MCRKNKSVKIFCHTKRRICGQGVAWYDTDHKQYGLYDVDKDKDLQRQVLRHVTWVFTCRHKSYTTIVWLQTKQIILFCHLLVPHHGTTNIPFSRKNPNLSLTMVGLYSMAVSNIHDRVYSKYLDPRGFQSKCHDTFFSWFLTHPFMLKLMSNPWQEKINCLNATFCGWYNILNNLPFLNWNQIA